MPYSQVNQLNLYYEEIEGDGPPVVLLHGLGSSSADWGLQTEAFSQRHRLIMVDLRGHGRSQDGARLYTIEQMAEDVAALIARLGIAPAHVVGLSLGGCTGQLVAVRHPECVRSLVLVNTFAQLRPTGLHDARRLARRAWLFATAPMPALADYVATGLFPHPRHKALRDEAAARLSRNAKRPYLASMLAVVRFDSRAQVGRIRCPTLVVAGDSDLTVPRAAVDALCRGIPGARFALIADSGHATPYDQPEAFNQVVLDFIASVR
jgi:3-oxoadipate enol-lactonase